MKFSNRKIATMEQLTRFSQRQCIILLYHVMVKHGEVEGVDNDDINKSALSTIYRSLTMLSECTTFDPITVHDIETNVKHHFNGNKNDKAIAREWLIDIGLLDKSTKHAKTLIAVIDIYGRDIGIWLFNLITHFTIKHLPFDKG